MTPIRSAAIHATERPFLSIEELDDQRRAHWLQTPYSAPVWQVADTGDESKTETICFEYRLADGSLLTEAPRLYATVKEYAWWVRDSRFTKIDDAVTHVSLVRNLMHIAHALTLRGIETFKFLVPYDIEQIVEECRFGSDSVLHASERVEKYLAELEKSDIKPPLYVSPDGRESNHFWSEKIAAACSLPPETAKTSPRISWLIGVAENTHGLTSRRNPAPEIPPFQNLTSQALCRWLDPIESLWIMRRHMQADALDFKPFPQGAAKVAATKGVVAERTPIPPPRLALHLFEQSVRWIFERSDALAARLKHPDGEKLRDDIVNMATACWIVIAAFTARRDREIDELSADCLSGDDAGGWWLLVYIEKTLQRKDWIPVPAIVARAVQILTAISEDARRQGGKPLILQWVGDDGSVVDLDVGRRLDDFAETVGVPLHTPRNEPPRPWHWTPHQMRRFFAVLYFYRYDGATIEALSHQLRHFSLEMTRRYVTQDKEVASIWSDVEWGYKSEVARAIVAGERAVGGPMGDRLKKVAKRIVDMFRRKLQIVTPDRAGASLSMFMERERLVLAPKPWVTCSCPITNDAARKAVCRQGERDLTKAKGPDLANAGPLTCQECPFAIIEGARTSYVAAEATHLKRAAAANSTKPTLFGALENMNLLEISTALDERYSAAKPLEPAFSAREES